MSGFDEFGESPKAPASDSPNKAIDAAIKKLMKKIDTEPADIAVKVIAQAIAWEKVKHTITKAEDEFDPDDL